MMPPTMPMRALRRTAMRTISQRVAPRASTPSFWLMGTALITSRVMEEITGRIMMDRMMLAVRMPSPKFEPEKNPVQPRVLASSGPRRSRTIGTRTKMAQRPYTTDGMAASNSVRKATMPRKGLGQISITKTATQRARGTAMQSARKDVANDEGQRAEVTGDGVPGGSHKELEAERMKRHPGVRNQNPDDHHDDGNDAERASQDCTAKNAVRPGTAAAAGEKLPYTGGRGIDKASGDRNAFRNGYGQ